MFTTYMFENTPLGQLGTPTIGNDPIRFTAMNVSGDSETDYDDTELSTDRARDSTTTDPARDSTTEEYIEYVLNSSGQKDGLHVVEQGKHNIDKFKKNLRMAKQTIVNIPGIGCTDVTIREDVINGEHILVAYEKNLKDITDSWCQKYDTVQEVADIINRARNASVGPNARVITTAQPVLTTKGIKVSLLNIVSSNDVSIFKICEDDKVTDLIEKTKVTSIVDVRNKVSEMYADMLQKVLDVKDPRLQAMAADMKKPCSDTKLKLVPSGTGWKVPREDSLCAGNDDDEYTSCALPRRKSQRKSQRKSLCDENDDDQYTSCALPRRKSQRKRSQRKPKRGSLCKKR